MTAYPAARRPRLSVILGDFRFVLGSSRLVVYELRTGAWLDSAKIIRPLPMCKHDLVLAGHEWIATHGPGWTRAEDLR